MSQSFRSAATLLSALWLPLVGLSACAEADDADEDEDDGEFFEDDGYTLEGGDEVGDEGVVSSTDDEDTCAGLSRRDAESVTHLLAEIGYTEFDDSEHEGQPLEIVTDAEHWAEVVARYGTDGGIRPDFDLDAVYVHPWGFDGCTDGPFYEAYRWDDELRLDIWFGRNEHCDMYLPMLDFIVVPAEGVETFGTCD